MVDSEARCREAAVGVLRAVQNLTGTGFYAAGALFNAPYLRLHGLRPVAQAALDAGNPDGAERLARELLSVAEWYRKDFNYGNAIHHGHLLLGEVALARGQQDTAAAELLAAADTPGSPQLNSFGPNMRLAAALLRLGKTEPVLEYLERCRRFWTHGATRLDQWSEAVRSGQPVHFGANLIY